jgi:hemolysin activation/secretion protein
MKYLRTIAAISVFSACAVLAFVNLDHLRNWLNPPPVASVRVEVPEPVVVLKEIEAEGKVKPEVNEQAMGAGDTQKSVVTPKPDTPTKPAVIAVPAPSPARVQTATTVKAEPPANPAQLAPSNIEPPQEVEAPREPVKPTAAVIAEQVRQPSPALLPASASTASVAPAPIVPAVAAVPTKEPEARPVVPAAPVPSPTKAVTQVAPVVVVPTAEPMVSSAPKPAATAAIAAQSKDSVAKPKPVVDKTKEIQLTIKDIQFTGVTVFPIKELTQVVSEFVGKELTVQEAFSIPAKVTQHYKRHNHMAIATLVGAISPDGVLTVGVVEMQMSQSQAEKKLALLPPETTSPAPAAPSVPLPSKNDDQSETDYILKNYANKTRQYEVIVDNFGHESTGSNRVGASIAFDGDKFSLLGLKSEGSNYLRMAARWATGIDGLKFGVNLSKLNYEVTQHLETAIYQSGDAAKKGVDLIYQLVNEPGHISNLGLHRVSKTINSIGLDLTNSSSMNSHVSTLEWRGVFREMMPGGAVFSYGTAYSRGDVDTSGSSTMGGLTVPEGPFAKLRFDGTLLQPLGGLGSVFGRLSIQTSDKNLDPSERFYLGGPTGVRAYGVGEGIGSKGELLTLEFRQRLAAGTTLAEFYDWGGVRQRDSESPKTVLKGYGLSLSQDMGGGTTLKGTWARSSGQPDPALPQNNNDQYDRNRFWLSMESRF